MSKEEWIRSRYWLSHFLYSRHSRSPINWELADTDSVDLRRLLGRWFTGLRQESAQSGPWLIARSMQEQAYDPYFIQTLRLLVKEQRYHADLVGQLVAKMDLETHGRWSHIKAATRRILTKYRRKLLGPRFEISILLLTDLLDLALLSRVEQRTDSSVIKGVCQNIATDKMAHIVFATEWLTLAYADFGFIRRSLRRLRLRAMWGVMLFFAVGRHGRLIKAIDSGRWPFIQAEYGLISKRLEQVVPYYRETLRAALDAQRRDRFAKPNYHI